MPGIVRSYAPDKVIVGQARPFIAPYDPLAPPALPANSVPLNGAWGGNWVELGATMKGLAFKVQRKVKRIAIEEQSTPVAIMTDSAEFSFDLELAEDSLETMRYAFGGGTITTVAPGSGTVGTRSLVIAADMTLFSFGFEGQNENGFWRRVRVPKVVSIANVTTSYQRADKQRTYKCEFESLVEITEAEIREMNAAAL